MGGVWGVIDGDRTVGTRGPRSQQAPEGRRGGGAALCGRPPQQTRAGDGGRWAGRLASLGAAAGDLFSFVFLFFFFFCCCNMLTLFFFFF